MVWDISNLVTEWVTTRSPEMISQQKLSASCHWVTLLINHDSYSGNHDSWSRSYKNPQNRIITFPQIFGVLFYWEDNWYFYSWLETGDLTIISEYNLSSWDRDKRWAPPRHTSLSLSLTSSYPQHQSCQSNQLQSWVKHKLCELPPHGPGYNEEHRTMHWTGYLLWWMVGGCLSWKCCRNKQNPKYFN